jgi:hypothetical protein
VEACRFRITTTALHGVANGARRKTAEISNRPGDPAILHFTEMMKAGDIIASYTFGRHLELASQEEQGQESL